MRKLCLICMLSLVFFRGYATDAAYVQDLAGNEVMMFSFEDSTTGEKHQVICRDADTIYFIQAQSGRLLRLSVKPIDRRSYLCIRATRL